MKAKPLVVLVKSQHHESGGRHGHGAADHYIVTYGDGCQQYQISGELARSIREVAAAAGEDPVEVARRGVGPNTLDFRSPDKRSPGQS